MLEEHYPFVAQPLPYEYDALLPVLDEETLHFHHDKHYQTYVDKLNATLADYPQLQQMSLTELLTSEDNILASLPEEARKSIHNNGGGVYNHQLYFDSMRSPAGQEPCGALEEALVRDFGSVRQWKEQMSQAATGVFGSGWAWLVSDQDGTLMVHYYSESGCPGSEIVYLHISHRCVGACLLFTVSEPQVGLRGRMA